MAADNDTNGNVRTREFYNARIEIIKEIHAMKDEIMKELGPIGERVKTNKEEIDNLRTRSNVLDGVIAFLTIVAGALGFR